MKKSIGIKANYYPEKRNFTELNIESYKFDKRLDLYRIIAFGYFKIFKKTHSKWLNLFYDFDLGNYHCLHFFNAISLGSKPWITTFEYYLPRGAHQVDQVPKETKYINKVINRLASPSCKQLIALSEHAKNAQINYLESFPKEIKDIIIDKIIVIHPPQKLLLQEYIPKPINKKLKLIIVGADFFRKGGQEIINAFKELKKQNIEVELTIVSSLQYGDYASLSTIEDLNEIKKTIEDNLNIIHYKSVPNNKVIDLFKTSDIALLPSYDETYGYTVLEAQACGCPIITTNGAAFKEINNDNCGWVIEVPLNDNRSIPRTNKNRLNFTEKVTTGLISIIKNVIANPELINQKGKASLERIKKYHSIEIASKKLENIYNSIN